jgi:glycosyltransferase involved in cell wall biosynthesis
MSSIEGVMSGVTYLLPVKPPSVWLVNCLESYVADNFEPRELIIIFNGGTCVEEYISIVDQILNGLDYKILTLKGEGISYALNAGLKLSKYKFIARIDADDTIISGRTFKQFNFLEDKRNSAIAVVGGQVSVIDRDGYEIKRNWYPTSPNLVSINFLVRNPVAHPAVMIRREVLTQLGGYRTDTKVEDLSLWIEILEKWKICNLSDTVIQYRKHNGQQTNLFRSDIFMESFKIRNKMQVKFLASTQSHNFPKSNILRFLIKYLHKNSDTVQGFEFNMQNNRFFKKIHCLAMKPNLAIFTYILLRIGISSCNRLDKIRTRKTK